MDIVEQIEKQAEILKQRIIDAMREALDFEYFVYKGAPTPPPVDTYECNLEKEQRSWIERMRAARCADCLWFQKAPGAAHTGRCHATLPSREGWPSVFETDKCPQFQNKFD